jgi:hypothetical protein
MNLNPEVVLKLSALVHVGLLAAGILMPWATGIWKEVAKLSPFARGLFKTYYCFIGLCLVSFGLGSWIFAAELAAGSAFSRAACGFLAVFWLIRLVAAIWVLDVRPYLTNGWWRLGYYATSVVFGLLPFTYAWLALRHT